MGNYFVVNIPANFVSCGSLKGSERLSRAGSALVGFPVLPKRKALDNGVTNCYFRMIISRWVQTHPFEFLLS